MLPACRGVRLQSRTALNGRSRIKSIVPRLAPLYGLPKFRTGPARPPVRDILLRRRELRKESERNQLGLVERAHLADVAGRGEIFNSRFD